MPSSFSVRQWFARYWRYGVALALSLLLHALIVAGTSGWQWPLDGDAEQMVEVQLVLPPPQPPPKPPLIKKASLVKKAAQPAPAEPVPPAEVPETPDAMSDNAAHAPVMDEHDMPAEVPEAEEEAVEFQVGHVDIRYDVLRGASGSKIGVAHAHYQANADATYSIRSEIEATGFASLVVSGKLVQVSEGSIGPRGLKPARFSYQYGNDRDRSQRAEFDWELDKLKLITSKGMTEVLLPDEAQDLLSFMYQFMFIPPLEHMQLSVTNGKRLRTYTYLFEGEELLHTPLGEIKALHIVKSNGDNDDKTELWLAVDYRYLPFRIRKEEKDGSILEQVITGIDADIFK